MSCDNYHRQAPMEVLGLKNCKVHDLFHFTMQHFLTSDEMFPSKSELLVIIPTRAPLLVRILSVINIYKNLATTVK